MAMPRFRLTGSWPRPADADAAARLLERFAVLGAAEARLAARPDIAELLAVLGGNSQYLSDLALREPRAVRLLAARGPDAVAAAAFDSLALTPHHAPRARIAAALRQAKRQIALAIAVADLGGIWPLERVTTALSELAERALSLAVAHLLHTAHEARELVLADAADPAFGSGFTVLGMGKLGARELNYSSDIDLVLLYDPDAHPEAGAAIGPVFTRIARGLVALMEARDPDGYVFRTDLRLRPDPAATPPAVALPAALAYYESMGQTWERAAMIKARPVAGDIALGRQFLDAIRPFVWRRHLDFAALSDIHGMKRRIDQKRGHGAGIPPASSRPPATRIAGHNLKLGHGGIREIEFVAQALQMVWGGRDPALRDPQTMPALRLLARAGHLPRRAAGELCAAYRFLRAAEHRLQMIADRQTHSLPHGTDELARFATFMGFGSADAFATVLLRHLTRVHAHFDQLFDSSVDAPDGSDAALDFGTGGDPPAATVERLATLGYRNARGIANTVRAWRAGRPRALRSERSRELLRVVLPRLLASLARQKDPDTAFVRFDAFLSRLPAGVQLLSLFQRNPALLDRVASVLGAAPSLADHLAANPSALEGLLSGEEIDAAPARTLRTQLRDARLLEDAIAIVRRTVRAEEFRLSVATMEGRLDADQGGLARTALADAALASLLPRVLRDFAIRHGRVRGGGMAVVALGKLGGREMMAGSDLDLMLIYDHPPDVTESRGARRLPASQYYIRAAHAFVAAVTAPGAEGPLYEVDMRLRPSGNKGPVAVSLESFRRYHAEDAWTWERMALTRARVIAGPPALRARVEAALAEALRSGGDRMRIRADAAAMRARLARDLPPSAPWDVKHRPGGLMEVEFIAQVLQLVHAAAHPGVCSATTRIALTRLAETRLLPPEDAAALVRADHLFRTVQGMLRVTVGRAPAADLPEAAAQALIRATLGADAAGLDLTALRATLDALGHQVRALFVRHVGDPEGKQK
jgi:glutamate-ammonia-ligase adenylyltransferase